MSQDGLYFESRTELIKRTSEWLIANGYRSTLTLICVGQLLRLEKTTTLEQDLKPIVVDMESNKEWMYSLEGKELGLKLSPYFLTEPGYMKAGSKTKELCVVSFKNLKEKQELSGNVRADVQRSIEMAMMYVEQCLGHNYEVY